jgi:hypothetical protein
MALLNGVIRLEVLFMTMEFKRSVYFTGNAFHNNGVLAYSKLTGNAFHNNGILAYSKLTGNAFHNNGVLAYSKLTGKYFDNRGIQKQSESFSYSLGPGIVIQILPNCKVIVYERKIN